MSFKAVMQLDGEEINVLDCQFSFTQGTDYNGKPASRPTGGQINVTIESDGSTELFDWMVSNTKTKSGSIIFYRRDALSKLKELKFSDAYCINYEEHFKASGEIPMQVRITISAKEVRLNSSAFENSWPV